MAAAKGVFALLNRRDGFPSKRAEACIHHIPRGLGSIFMSNGKTEEGDILPMKITPGEKTVRLVFLAALLFYGAMIWHFMGAYGGGSDSSGYLNCARMISQGKIVNQQRVVPGVYLTKTEPALFVPYGFIPLKDQKMACFYSIGLPGVLAVVASVTGWSLGPHITMLLFCLVGVLATALLARLWGLSWFWAWVPAFLLAGSPLYITMSIQLLSDVPALVCATLAVILAQMSRERVAFAFLSGVMVAIGVLVRPTNALVIFPVLVCLGFSWKRWLLLGLGGFPGAVALALYNHAVFTSSFSSGYNGYGVLFQAENILPALQNYAIWFPVLMSPLVVLAFGIPFLFRRALALIVWIVAVLGVYATYWNTHETWWYLRFVLPVFPAILVGVVMVLKEALETAIAQKVLGRISEIFALNFPMILRGILWVIFIGLIVFWAHETRHDPRWYFSKLFLLPVILVVIYQAARLVYKGDFVAQLRVVGVLFLITAVGVYYFSWNVYFDVSGNHVGNAQYPDACNWATANVPANAVIYSAQMSGALFYYTPFKVVRFDVLDKPQRDEIGKACAQEKIPIYALLYPAESQKLKKGMDEQWEQVGTIRDVTCWHQKGTGDIPVK